MEIKLTDRRSDNQGFFFFAVGGGGAEIHIDICEFQEYGDEAVNKPGTQILL